MPSRSFKPASYLASAAQASAPGRSPRPSFTRASSSSSTTSDDSLLSNLRGMKVVDEGGDSAPHSPGFTTPRKKASTSSLSAQYREDTPGRNRSQPIAIELPQKEKIYTPLSTRGDVPGGYFPSYGEIPKLYRPHLFGESKPKVESPIMSASSSLMSSPTSEFTPKGPSSRLLSPFFGPLSPSIPEPLVKPMGKYHPANYKSPANTQVSTPTSVTRPLPPCNLSIPTSSKRKPTDRPHHERKTSDVKRKLQEYQRNMITQARAAASSSIAGTMNAGRKEPSSPRLLPAGSPGPITPFELEDIENEGYIDAGNRARTNSHIPRGLERHRQEVMDALKKLDA